MFFFQPLDWPLEARAGLVLEGAFPGKAAIVCKDQGEARSFPVDPKDTALVPWIAPVKTLYCSTQNWPFQKFFRNIWSNPGTIYIDKKNRITCLNFRFSQNLVETNQADVTVPCSILKTADIFFSFLLDIDQLKNHMNFWLHQVLGYMEIPDQNIIEFWLSPRSWLICSSISWSQLVVWVSIIQISHQPHGKDLAALGRKIYGSKWHNHAQSRNFGSWVFPCWNV